MNNKNAHINYVKFFLLFVIFFVSRGSYGQNCGSVDNVGGTVFIDYNFNGEYDEASAGLQGVTVEAYNYQGFLLGSAVTNNKGKYIIGVPSGLEVRLQFSNFPEGYYEGYYGSDNKTSVCYIS